MLDSNFVTVVVEEVDEYKIPQSGVVILKTLGYDINKPLVMSCITLILSNLVSNVLAGMLLLKNPVTIISITYSLWVGFYTG